MSRAIGFRREAWRRLLASHPDVAECAVLGVKDDIKGEQPCGFIVLKADVTRDPALIEKEIVALVRDKIGPVAAFKIAIAVNRLPKPGRANFRGTMKKIADHDAWTMPATIDDPVVLEEVARRSKAVASEGAPGCAVNRVSPPCRDFARRTR